MQHLKWTFLPISTPRWKYLNTRYTLLETDDLLDLCSSLLFFAQLAATPMPSWWSKLLPRPPKVGMWNLIQCTTDTGRQPTGLGFKCHYVLSNAYQTQTTHWNRQSLKVSSKIKVLRQFTFNVSLYKLLNDFYSKYPFTLLEPIKKDSVICRFFCL